LAPERKGAARPHARRHACYVEREVPGMDTLIGWRGEVPVHAIGMKALGDD
jgi:hypothetical protein